MLGLAARVMGLVSNGGVEHRGRATFGGAWRFTRGYLGRVLAQARYRKEIGWVIGRTLAEFFLQFLTLKLFTRWLGQEGYGVFNLSLTALMLFTNAALMPVNQTYQRYFYTAIEKGVARAAGRTLFRWYAVVTIAVVLVHRALRPCMPGRAGATGGICDARRVQRNRRGGQSGHLERDPADDQPPQASSQGRHDTPSVSLSNEAANGLATCAGAGGARSGRRSDLRRTPRPSRRPRPSSSRAPA